MLCQFSGKKQCEHDSYIAQSGCQLPVLRIAFQASSSTCVPVGQTVLYLFCFASITDAYMNSLPCKHLPKLPLCLSVQSGTDDINSLKMQYSVS